MAKTLYWEDISEGMELSPLVKRPTTRQLVKYAGASGDFYEIHYDKDFAQSAGLNGVIIHGALKNAFLGQFITDLIGEEGSLRKLSCQYRGMDAPGDTLTCKGRVIRKYTQANNYLLDCEIWLENAKGQKTTRGWATVTLVSRESGQ